MSGSPIRNEQYIMELFGALQMVVEEAFVECAAHKSDHQGHEGQDPRNKYKHYQPVQQKSKRRVPGVQPKKSSKMPEDLEQKNQSVLAKMAYNRYLAAKERSLQDFTVNGTIKDAQADSYL
ncbi:hypothetical protein NDU88_004648 [Pleurodeles waltl]|uniref:Uncharacterized protein n=1 Tax=Pleurodeles waltl TaxID=8319 RepID=A0AAV7W5K1_PLEWA|nr:hypothetical protein NDU88_004648 [Pleurodeles waltl]